MQDETKEGENPFSISDFEIQSIEENLEKGQEKAVDSAIASLNAPDCAELLGKVTEDHRQTLLEQHSGAITPDAFTELDPELRKNVLQEMEVPQVAELVSSLESDDALEVIENLEEDFQKNVIRKLPIKKRISLEEGLSFPENSAGRLLQKEFVAIPQSWTVGETLDSLRASSEEDIPAFFSDIFIVTPQNKVTGRVPLAVLIRSNGEIILETLAQEKIYSIPASFIKEIRN